RFDRIPNAGHQGALVARFAAELVSLAAEARAPEHPSRVTFKSVRAANRDAYGVHISSAGPGDAMVDLERRADGVHVLHASGITSITLASGALGVTADAPIHFEPGVTAVPVHWETAPVTSH